MALKPKDYRSELEPVWCTGCGDNAIRVPRCRSAPVTGINEQ